MPHHAGAYRFSHHQPDSAGGGLSRVGEKVDHDRAAAYPPSPPGHGGEISSRPKTVSGGQHLGRPAQADSSPRPLRRRACRMARPARVRIRRRKPWVLARRRLFGWKVRLLTVWLHRNLCAWGRLAGALGWVAEVAPGIGRDLGGTAQEVAAGKETAHEVSTVRIDPCRGQTGARPRLPAPPRSQGHPWLRQAERARRPEAWRHARGVSDVAARHCELTGCAVKLSARTQSLRH